MQKAKTRKTTTQITSRSTIQRQATIKPTVPKGKAAPTLEASQATLQRALEGHLTRPVEMQRQVASPALQAAHLYSTEYQGAAQQTASLQRQVTELQASLPANALQSALQRQAQTSATPQRPVTVGDWAFAMQREAQRIEGQRLNTQQHQQFMALQRHVTNTLVQGFRQDRQPAAERYAQYGEHLATLQRHPLSGLVAQSAMRHMPASERPALQRAVDEALQRQQKQDAQDAAALNLQALQRQLAEQEGKAQESVMQRIQAKRGAGNPLPAAVQRHLEHGLNHDLSGVRIHDDAEAHKLSQSVNATAFTTGKDIFFQAGKFNPNTQSGLELLAHEVTHTVQQSQGKVGKGIDPDAGLENEAREMGKKLAQKAPKASSKPKTVRFGNRQPGALTHARQPLQRSALTESAQAIQRWGLGDLKKLAKGGVQRATKAAQVIKQASGRVIAVVKAAPQKIAAKTKQIQQAAKAKLNSVKSRATAAMTKIRRQVTAKAQSVKRRAGAVATQVTRQAQTKFNQLKKTAQEKLTRLKQQTAVITSRISQQVKAKYQSVKRRVNYGLHKAQTRVKAAFESTKRRASARIEQGKRTLTAKVQSLTRRAKAVIQRAKVNAKAKFNTLKTKAKATWQSSKRRAKATLASAFRKTKTGVAKFLKSRPATSLLVGGGAALAAYQAIKKGGIKGLAKSVKEKAGAAWKWAKSPEGKAAMARMAVTVGVGIGAAALTTLTGGLAAPLLIMAAGGAAGGALGRMAQNQVLKSTGGDKYKNLKVTEGVTLKNALLDGALGAAMGPAGALVGSGAKFVAGNVGRYVLKPGAQAAMRGLGVQGARAGTQAARSGTQTTQAGRAARDGSRTTSGTNTSQEIRQLTLRERGKALWEEVKVYNRGLAAESKSDIIQSIRGSAGLAGRAKQEVKTLFGGKRQVKDVKQNIAKDAVRYMDHREVLKIASDMRIPTNMSIDKLRTVVVSNLIRTNHKIVAKPFEKKALQLVRKQGLRDMRRHILGAPQRHGESTLRAWARQGGNALTMGMRATYSNVVGKDKAWSEAISRGSGFAYMSGSIANESTKAAGLAVRTEMSKPAEQRENVDISEAVQSGLIKSMQDGVLKASGANPDWFTEKAVPALLGVDQTISNLASSTGASNIADNSQYEDAPERKD